MHKPITPADVTPAMRYRHIGQWRAFYASAIQSCLSTEALIGDGMSAQSHVMAAAKIADAALAHELNLIPRLQFLEDKTQPENTHGH